MYEHRAAAPLTRREFAARAITHVILAFCLLGLALGIGVAGYHFVCGLSWIDSLYNASMILGGMGPANELQTDSGKAFASFYALFSGLFFIAIAGFIIAPFAHRMLHHFHWDESLEQSDDGDTSRA
ncbi:MAG: hypothetical protein H0W86_12915 [Armatimonadetes bacterium]|nr:hypothetical protein [Armatimonadota bacterium]